MCNLYMLVGALACAALHCWSVIAVVSVAFERNNARTAPIKVLLLLLLLQVWPCEGAAYIPG
jgi:hypothetical protein